MKNINLNSEVWKDASIPIICSTILTGTLWFFSGSFNVISIGKELPTQILLFITYVMLIFVTFIKIRTQKLTKITLIAAILNILLVIILFISQASQVALLALLAWTPFLSTLLPYHENGTNFIGLISSAIILGLLIPISFFYLTNHFVTSNILLTTTVLALSYLFIMFNLFISVIPYRDWLVISIGVITILISLLIIPYWESLLIGIVLAANWLIFKLELHKKLIKLAVPVSIIINALILSIH